MKRLSLIVGAFAAALSLAVGLSSALAANHSLGSAVKLADAGPGLGRILVDGHGRTLYLFEKDKHGKSACAGKCATYWPPLIATGKPIATAGAKASLLGTIRRADGRLQVTYNHHPLYTFVQDTRKGQANGENVDAFGAEWYAVSSAGAKVERSAAESTGGGSDPVPSGAGDPAPGGYGYGY